MRFFLLQASTQTEQQSSCPIGQTKVHVGVQRSLQTILLLDCFSTLTDLSIRHHSIRRNRMNSEFFKTY